MKKYLVSSGLLFGLILVIGLIMFNARAENEVKIDGGKMALEIASVYKENNALLKDRTEVATANGLPLYAGEIEYWKLVFEHNPAREGNLYEAAIQFLAQEKTEFLLAEKLNISVTEEEIQADIERDRQITYTRLSDEELGFFQDYLSQLGLSEEEYWTEYRPTEVLRYFTHQKVQHYLENNPKVKELPEIQELIQYSYEMTDDSLKNKVNQ